MNNGAIKHLCGHRATSPAGRIVSERAGLQIREFAAARQKYQRRHQGGNIQIPGLAQLMEEEDLEQIRVVMTARFQKEDREKFPEQYQRRAREEADSDEEEEEEEEEAEEEIKLSKEDLDGLSYLSGSLKLSSEESPRGVGIPQLAKSAKVAVEPAAALIGKRKKTFEAEIFNEENLLAALRIMYGPKNLVQAVEILKNVKMDKSLAPYRSLQGAAEFVSQFDEALLWIKDCRPPSRVIRDIFIKGIQPYDLQQELTLRSLKRLSILKESFTEL